MLLIFTIGAVHKIFDTMTLEKINDK